MPSNAQITDRIENSSICRNFLDQVERNPQDTALRWKDGDDWHALTYQELKGKIASVAAGLAGLGIKQGDRVMLMMRNRYEFHILDLAALFLGATPVSIYNTSSSAQIKKVVTAADAKAIFVEDHLSEVVETMPSNDLPGHVMAVGSNFSNSTGSYSDLDEVIGADLEALASKVDSSQMATLIFTSGTTGDPKGVVLDHANVSWTVACLRRRLELGVYEGTKLISYLPMAHIAERMVSHYTGLLSGFEVTCCPEPTDVAKYALEVRPNILFGVPRVYEKIYSKVKLALEGEDPTAAKRAIAALKVKLFSKKIRAKIGLDQLVVAVSGGAPLSPDVMQWFLTIGVPMSEIYGLSETSGPMTWHPTKPKVGYVGPACPGVEVKLADDGEIMCRGGNIFRGYLDRPDLTSEVMFEGGWFATGDIGEFDEDNYLKVIDRKKELIVTSGGKNISPSMLENSMKLSPLVAQAIAIGDRRKYVTALVTLEPEAVESWAESNGFAGESFKDLAKKPELVQTVQEQVGKEMESYSSAEKVKKLIVLDEEWLPDSECLTPTSKLRRKVIFDKYSTEIDSLYRD